MSNKNMFVGGLLFGLGMAIGLGLPALSAQQRGGRGPQPPTLDQVPQEILTLRQQVFYRDFAVIKKHLPG